MSPPPKSQTRSLGVRIDADLADRLRAFCRDHAGKPLYLTVNGFVAEAVARHLADLERQVASGDADVRPRLRGKPELPSRNGRISTPLGTP